MDTSYGIQIIAGASGFSKIANLNEDERRDFIAELAALSDADVLIIDCAAGSPTTSSPSSQPPTTP